MKYLDDAIYKLNPSVVRCSGSTTIKAFDKDGNEVSYDLSAAQAEFNKYKYKSERTYPDIGDQLDNLYKDILAGKVDATGEFAKAIKTVKDAHPKP
jgi:hypothetical protein